MKFCDERIMLFKRFRERLLYHEEQAVTFSKSNLVEVSQ